ncbi:Clp protease, partial [Parabacteroides distasonis]
MANNEENKNETAENKEEKLKEFGQVSLSHKIHLITIIGEIEGHECLPANTKTTKYEHILPQLAAIE